MEIELYGWQHFTYLAVVIILMAVALIAVKRFAKTEKSQIIIVKIVAAVLLMAVVANRLSLVYKNGDPNWYSMIPNTFCGTSSFVLSLSVLLGKKNAGILHFIAYLALAGGVATLIYPDFIGQNASLFYLPTITGLLHHTFMIFLVLLMSMTGYFVPDIKKWYYIPLGLSVYMTYGIFLVDIVGIHAMTIGDSFEGLEGLTWFTVGLLFMGGCMLYLAVYTAIMKRKSKQISKK